MVSNFHEHSFPFWKKRCENFPSTYDERPMDVSVRLFASGFVLLGGHPCVFILHTCSFTNLLPFLHTVLYILACVCNLRIPGTYEAVQMVPRKLYLCDNKRCVAMSKAFLYWLMWCLSVFHWTGWLSMRQHQRISQYPQKHFAEPCWLGQWLEVGMREGFCRLNLWWWEWTGCGLTKVVLLL